MAGWHPSFPFGCITPTASFTSLTSLEGTTKTAHNFAPIATLLWRSSKFVKFNMNCI